MTSRLTAADRQLARIKVNLSERFGKDVDPRVREIAEAAVGEDAPADPVVPMSETSRPRILTLRFTNGKVANYRVLRTNGGKLMKLRSGGVTPPARLRTASRRFEGPDPSS